MAQTELLFLILTGIQAQIPRYIFVAHLTYSIDNIHSVVGLLVKLQNICIIYFRGFVIFCYLIFSFVIATNYLLFNLFFPFVHSWFLLCFATCVCFILANKLNNMVTKNYILFFLINGYKLFFLIMLCWIYRLS